jgi:hypothetical protein
MKKASGKWGRRPAGFESGCFFWIPAIIVTSFVLSAPLAWFIAPSMMMRFIQAHRVH